jgi:hypothetical protein
MAVAAVLGEAQHRVARDLRGEVAALGVSRPTVESHVSAAYRKLEVSSRVALTRTALRYGIDTTG